MSSFAGHGKKSAWNTWNANPQNQSEFTKTFLSLSMPPVDYSPHNLQVVEQFVIQMFDKSSTCSSVNDLRRILFSQSKTTMERLPPTKDALNQHALRAIHQSANIWGHSIDKHIETVDPENWGWERNDDGTFHPKWMTILDAAKSCLEISKCGCKNCTPNRCSCKKTSMKCTSLCKCDGDCNENEFCEDTYSDDDNM